MKAHTDSMKGWVRWIVPPLGAVLWAALFWGALSFGPRMMNIDGDLGRHLAIGRYILDSGSIPLQDLFSHSMAGQPLTPHEWLAQAAFALAARGMELDGVVVLVAALIATAFTWMFRLALDRSQSVLAALFVAGLGAAVSTLHWLTRPHVFTFLFIIAWVAGLEALRQGKSLRAWVWLPILMGVWANTHGAFIAGFVVWAIYGIGWLWERVLDGKVENYVSGFARRFLGVGLASAAISLINPAGWQLWSTSIGYLRSGYLTGHTAEYLSPDFHSPSTWPFLLMAALALGAFGWSGKKRPVYEIGLVCAWLVMALVSVRNVPLFTLAAGPVIAAACAETARSAFSGWKKLLATDEGLLRIERMARGGWFSAAVLVLATGLLAGGVRLDAHWQGNRFDPGVFPVAAVDWLESHPQNGDVFNYFPWGGYLLYREWPRTRVFIDGQTDFYGEALTREYETVLTGMTGWQEVLNRYSIDWVLWPAGDELVGRLTQTGQWVELYRDDTAVILRKQE